MNNHGLQEGRVSTVNEKDLAELCLRSNSFTVMKDDEPLCCFGSIEATKYRAMVWGVYQKTNELDFIYSFRHSKRFLDSLAYIRIEAYVDPSLVQAMRFIKMLGFELENPFIPFHFPDGSGASLWAMMKWPT